MKEVFTAITISALHNQIEEFMENHDVYDWESVTIVTEKITDFEDAEKYIWQATLTPLDTKEALITQLVEEFEIINHFFTEQDINDRVKALFEDDFIPVEELTKEQMEHVKHVLSDCDCEYGLNWDSIDGAITDLFEQEDEEDSDNPDWENRPKNPGRYRYLEAGETVEAGDEYRFGDGGQWEPASGNVGAVVTNKTVTEKAFRRPIAEPRYRPFKEGDVIEEGDQIVLSDRKWHSFDSKCFGETIIKCNAGHPDIRKRIK